VTYEDQHRRSVAQRRHEPEGSGEAFGHRVEPAVAEEGRRRARIAEPLCRHSQTQIADADASIGTLHHPRSTIGSGASSNDRPNNGHQNTSVSLQAPSNTRCRIIPIGRPEQHLADRLASRGGDHQHGSRPTLTVTLCSALAPPKTPSSDREHRADDQQPVVEPRIAEHDPDGHDRGADEPEEHAGVPGSDDEETAAVGTVGDPGVGRLVLDGVDLGGGQLEVAALALLADERATATPNAARLRS
jgi:hypothetical protein